MIGVTHTFSAPHTRSLKTLAHSDAALQAKNQEWMQRLTDAIRCAVSQACANQQEVALSYQNVILPLSVNRDVETVDGYWLGRNPSRYSDVTVPVLKVWSQAHELLGMIYTVDVQSSLVEALDGTMISSDLLGHLSCEMEERIGGTALCLLGAAADQVPKETVSSIEELHAQAAVWATRFSQQLTMTDATFEGNVELASFTVTVPGQVIVDRMQLVPTRTYDYQEDSEREVTITILTIDSFHLAMLKPELSSATGHRIRSTVANGMVMVATMMNGGQKYMPEADSYDKMTYEAMNSMFAKGSAESVQQCIQEYITKGESS